MWAFGQIRLKPFEEMAPDFIVAAALRNGGHAGRIVPPVIEPAPFVEVDREFQVELGEERLVLIHLQRTGEALFEPAERQRRRTTNHQVGRAGRIRRPERIHGKHRLGWPDWPAEGVSGWDELVFPAGPAAPII